MDNYITLDATVEIVTSYVGNNTVSKDDLPVIVKDVFTALYDISNPNIHSISCEELKPAVPIKKSVKEETITCLDCGKAFQSLRRHIGNSHGMTPEEYRIHWKLPEDYPMTAPAYSVRRSELAKDMGLGNFGKSKKGDL
jgi:predicted transcriptional regulator